MSGLVITFQQAAGNQTYTSAGVDDLSGRLPLQRAAALKRQAGADIQLRGIARQLCATVYTRSAVYLLQSQQSPC